jgi:RND family efflux transporter MFP subunit
VNRTRIVVLAALGIAAVATVVVASARADAKKPEAAAAPKAALAAVSLAEVKAITTASRTEATGQLQPAKGLNLGFEVGGRLLEIEVKKGAPVVQGQVIARLDPELVDAQLLQAEAALKAAEAQAAIAADAAARVKALKETSNVSEQQATAAEGQSATAAAQVAAAKAQVAQLRAMRKRHDLHAPFSGILTDAPDQVGAYVAAGATLFTLEQLDPLTLKITVSEADRELLRLGTRVRVESTATGVVSDEATVKSVINSADPQTKRVPVEINVPNKAGRFTAHTLARAVVELGAAQQALSVPASALASTGGDHVFVVGEGGEVRKVAVTVLDRGAQQVVVRAAEPVSKVVDYPAVDLAQGQKVSVR